MKTILNFLIIFVLLLCWYAAGATYPNKFVTNANPESVSWTNTSAGGITVNGGRFSGDSSGITNITGLGFSGGAAVPTSTNLNVVVSNIYQSVTLSADCNVTNVSGIGSASVKFLPGGANRLMSFPTNWAWLNTNGFALSGSLYSITLTNAASKIGWLSVVKSGDDATNVAAAYQQTP